MGVVSEEDLLDFLPIVNRQFSHATGEPSASGRTCNTGGYVVQGGPTDGALEERFGVAASAKWRGLLSLLYRILASATHRFQHP